MSHPRLPERLNRANRNHHLWNNHGTWWVHYTLHLPDFTKQRVRRSLATRSIETARRRRDAVLAAILDSVAMRESRCFMKRRGIQISPDTLENGHE